MVNLVRILLLALGTHYQDILEQVLTLDEYILFVLVRSNSLLVCKGISNRTITPDTSLQRAHNWKYDDGKKFR